MSDGDAVEARIAQRIWECYVVEVGRALPEGLADKLAAAVMEVL